MTAEELHEQIAGCLAAGDSDPEGSHGWIDGICEGVIEAIAQGATDPRGLAQLAKGLLDATADWVRWYA